MKTSTTLFTLLFSIGLFAQGLKISPEAVHLLHDAQKFNLDMSRKSSLTTEFINEHRIYSIKDKAYVGSILLTSDQVSESQLTSKGVIIRTKAGNIWTASLPIDKITEVAQMNGIDYVQLARPAVNKLDTALIETDVVSVHAGLNLSSNYMGEDVVVGVIDGGFDYTHPAFYDNSQTTNRIVRAWNNSGNASPPSGFQFGSEFSNTVSIEGQQSDGIDDSHGTHVAGIAAGSGYGNSAWNGVAPMSDIIMVSTDIPTNGVDNVIDGISYIFQYAANEGKPAVVNLSLGSHVGPHDGSSLFDQALNNLAGPSKIVVGAAGNEGSTRLHLSANLSNSDTLVTFVGNAGYEDGEAVDIWGESGFQFEVQVALIDTLNGFNIDDQSSFYASNTNTLHEITLVDGNNDTCLVAFTTNGSQFNQKPNILMQHYNKGSLPLALVITAVSPTSSTIHLWNHANGNGAPFYSNGWFSLVDGNTDITIGEIGGTADSIITVGAYTTKNSYTNIQNTQMGIPLMAPIGAIAPFSSKGPTVDNRFKPEITAPGNVVVSAINSFSTEYDANSPTLAHSQVHNNKTYYYAALEGTSMATPMVTGIIALWLENYNNLSVEEIKAIFAATAREDGFTGNNLPDNTWGHGKIDAYAGLVIVGLNENQKDEKYTIYPNPAQDRIHILSEDKMQEIMIFSSTGKLIKSHSLNGISKVIDVSDLENGVYLMRVRKENGMSSRSLVIAR